MEIAQLHAKAHDLIKEHGDNALNRALVETMHYFKSHDMENTKIWLKIGAIIKEIHDVAEQKVVLH